MSNITSPNHIAYQIDMLDKEIPLPMIAFVEWSAENLPEGLSISPTDGTLSGTIPSSVVGTYDAKISVRTMWGSTTKVIRITVLPSVS